MSPTAPIIRSRRRVAALLVTITTLLLAGLAGVQQAQAQHPGGPTTTHDIQPVRHAGNQNCAELFPGTVEQRIQSPADGTFTQDGYRFTMDVSSLAEGEVFDFTANSVVLGIAVKGGDSVNAYDYRPLGGVRDDTYLHAPVNHSNGKYFGLSHVSVCFMPPPELVVAKTADASPVSSGEAIGFTVTVTNVGTGTAFNTTLTDALPAADGVDWSIDPAYTGPGTCEITGTPPSETLSCAFGDLAGNASVSVHVASATTELTAGTLPNTATAQADNAGPVSANASITVNPPALEVAKTADHGTVSSTESIGFTITVTNNGAGTAFNATLADALPAADGVDWSIDPAYPGPGTCAITGTPPSETLSCAFGDLAPGASASVHVTSPTGIGTHGTLENTATADADNAPPASGNDSVTVQQPSLLVDKQADDPVVSSGEGIGFTITVSNDGDGVAFNTTLADPLPSGAGVDWALDPASAGASFCTIAGAPPSESLECAFGQLLPGTSISVRVTSATTEATAGELHNVATARADNAPPTSDDAAVTVNPPQLEVTKVADRDSVSSGETIGFTISVTNSGSGTAFGATLSDALPAADGVDWTLDPAYGGPGTCEIAGSAGAETLTCAFGDLAPGATVSVHVSSATTETTAGTLDNTATADGDNAPPATGSDDVTVLQPDVAVSKAADSSTVDAAGSVGYTITVANAGPGTAFDVALHDPLPGAAGLDWSIDPAYEGPGTCEILGDPGLEALSCSLGHLGPGAVASVHVVSATTAASCGELVNVATADGDNLPEVSSGAATIVVRCAALSVAKISCPVETVAPGGVLTYTVDFANNGDADATAARLVDVIPEGTTVDDPGTGAVSADGTTITWELGTLAAGATGSVTFSVVVPASLDGSTLVNQVTLTSPQGTAASASWSTAVSSEGAAAGARAFGISAELLGGTLPTVEPTPDTDVSNPDRLLDVAVPETSPVVAAEVLAVTSSHDVGSTGSDAEAIATAADVVVDLPGVVSVEASSIVARSHSLASPTDAGSSFAGSRIQDLVINGTTYGDASGPVTIDVNDPAGVPLAQVRVLEVVDRSGAAAGDQQPEADAFASGLAVNGIRVVVFDNPLTLLDESSDIVVSRAESSAAFPSGLACGQGAPAVAGDAYLVDVSNVEPPVGAARLGLVELGSTGGSESAAVADLGELGSGTGLTAVAGSLAPLRAEGSAEVQSLDLLGGQLTATLVRASSQTDDGTAAGATTIADLVVAGTDVCAALGLQATCAPDPNTVLVLDEGNVIVLLNEQITGSGLRVNAVHVYVVGKGNVLGLPAGAELVISSAHSHTVPA